MPKVANTRRDKAAELERLVRDGPAFVNLTGAPFTPEEAMARTKSWLSTWVEPLVRDLVPELRPPRGRR